MKQLTEKQWRTQPNGWGQDSTSAEQIFEIETSDVGKDRANWRGHGHSIYTFRGSDVGRQIAVYTDRSNWTCWVFNTQRAVSNG